MVVDAMAVDAMAEDVMAVDTMAAISQKGGHYGGKERVTHISEIFELFFHEIRYTAI